MNYQMFYMNERMKPVAIYTLGIRVLKTCLNSIFARAMAIDIIQQGMIITLGVPM